jgi:hypothetical protein
MIEPADTSWYQHARIIRRMLDSAPEVAGNVVALLCVRYFNVPAQHAAEFALSFAEHVMTTIDQWTLHYAALVARADGHEYWRRRSRTPVTFDTSRAGKVSIIATLSALQPRYREQLRQMNAGSERRAKTTARSLREMRAAVIWQTLAIRDILTERQPVDDVLGL